MWTLGLRQQLQLFGFFLAYNLSLYSNSRDGLIRQSEFPTVTGGSATYINNLTHSISFLAGLDYQRDAHEGSIWIATIQQARSLTVRSRPSPPTTSRSPTARLTYPSMAQCFAIYTTISAGGATKYSSTILTCSRLKTPTTSSPVLTPPKATVSFLPQDRPFLPSIALNFGEAFCTNDPRIGTGTMQGTPVGHEHAYQLVVSETIAATDFRITLAHSTNEASLAKIDLGVNFLIASGYTGQTTEVLGLPSEAAPFERVVGIRSPPHVSIAYTYHFRPEAARNAID